MQSAASAMGFIQDRERLTVFQSFLPFFLSLFLFLFFFLLFPFASFSFSFPLVGAESVGSSEILLGVQSSFYKA